MMDDKIEVPEIEYSVLRKFADDKRCNFKELCDAVRESVEAPLRLRTALLREAAQPSSAEFAGTQPPCCYACATPMQRVSWMIVCPHCGNKRCPRAESHRSACTGSNEPNQTASPCCGSPAQCWEPCGELGKSAEHARPAEELRRDAELGRIAMRFVDRAGDVHPGIDDADRICAEFYAAMSEVLDRAAIAAAKREGE